MQHLTLGLVIALDSGRTLIHAWRAEHGHLGILAATESTGALLFLWPRTMRLGGIALMTTLAIALLAHALAGEFPTPLAVYAAATLCVTLHGSVWPSRQPVVGL